MLQQITNSSKRVAKAVLFRNTVPCFWSKTENWGDALNPYLVERISGRSARFDANPHCWKHLVIGSILDKADPYSIVWGSGIIAPNTLPQELPHAIHAVRGPLTREQLIRAGIPCPSVFGDPALLLPRYFNPPRKIKWKVGIIPHYTDQNHPWVESVGREEGVNVINICSGIENFVHEVLSCESILSSSLHGLICSDAYGIPNRRIVLNHDVIGGDFKFFDYYAAMGLQPEATICPKGLESAIDLIPAITRNECSIDLDLLLDVCSFRN